MISFARPAVVVALLGAYASADAGGLPMQYANVVSSTPVVVQTSVATRQCEDVPGYVQTPTSGGGAVVGGILGGLAGNAIGAGAGRAVATGVGALAGALVGNSVEASSTPPTSVVTTNCIYSRSPRSQVIGYDVVYEFGGQRYTTRTARDPGDRLALDVRPSGAASYDGMSMADQAQGSVDSSPYGPTLSGPMLSGPMYPAVGTNVGPVYGRPYSTPYTDTYYPYPPFNDAAVSYGYPVAPVYIEGRFGGRGRHWR